uniref:Uncharacterized protein n=1 Tax=Peronospora matthiolae TaxID=2874970 RepID=A0AAV1UF98_9STRA
MMPCGETKREDESECRDFNTSNEVCDTTRGGYRARQRASGSRQARL